MTAPYRKKLIEVALPLEAINRESAREKSIRHGHPSTLHLWWARRPLAAARAVLFAQLVDDPSAWPERFPTEEEQERERKRLFGLIEEMVRWEASNDEHIIGRARLEIAQSWARGHASPKATTILKLTVEDLDRKEARALVDEFLIAELPPVHDPFAGGGTIPLEAQRLGLRAIASDLNPVAVLINKALIEIPSRFAGQQPVNPESRRRPSDDSAKRTGKSKRGAQAKLAGVERVWKGARGLADDVRYYGAWMRDEARKRIGHMYPDVEVTVDMAKNRPDLKDLVGKRLTVIAWLWARTVASPDPAFAGAHVPLVSSFWLSSKTGKEVWVEPVVNGREYRFETRYGAPPNPTAVGLGTRAGKAQDFICILSKSPIGREYIRAEGKAGRLGQRLMAIVAAAEGQKGRVYCPATADAERASALAELNADVVTAKETFLSGATPSRAMITGGVCSAYGLSTWGHLFTPRQTLALVTLCDLARDASIRAAADAAIAGVENAAAYGEAVATYLGLGVSRLADRSSTLCSWDSGPTGTKSSTGGSARTASVRNTFARQALPMIWDFAEASIFSESGGGLESSLAWLIPAIEHRLLVDVPGRVMQANAVTAIVPGAVVSTDPPYYDNISYSELSDFFYVWLRRALREIVPELFTTLLTPKTEELVATPHRQGSQVLADEFFINGLRDVFGSVVSRADPDTPVAIYYAFKQSETTKDGTSSTGWETFLRALLEVGMEIRGTWPVRTELGNRMVGKGTNALASSIVLACRPRERDARVTRAEFRRLLREELPAALRALQQSRIAPVDIAQAAIGPGMAVFSRYATVLEPDGSPMSIRAALQLINEVLDEHLVEQEGEFDSGTRFAVTWYEVHAFDAGSYGEAETLATARAVAVTGIAEAGILRSGGGKVRLLKRAELPSDWDPAEDARLTVWEATQHLIKRLEERGEDAAAELLDRLGGTADAARDLAYRLFSTCERKGWAEEARAYNGLVAAWPDLEKLAASRVETPAQQKLV